MPSSTQLSSLSAARSMTILDHVAEVMHRIAIHEITRASTTATAKSTLHGLSTSDSIVVAGADQADYNGTFTVTVVDKNTFTYTVSNSPATPATGRIEAKDASKSFTVPNCTAVQVEIPPAGTTLKIEKKVHFDATWVQEGADITSATGTPTIVSYAQPLAYVRVRRSAGAGNAKAYAQRV